MISKNNSNLMDDECSSYEDEVIKAAKQGLADAITPLTPQFETLLRMIYRAGYHEAQRNLNGYSGTID